VTTPQAGAPAITGTVNFVAGQVSLGSAPVTNGQAQITTSSLPAGAGSVVNVDVIEAIYSGDTNFVTSTGGGDVNVTLLPATVALTTSNSSIPVGASVTFIATVTATGNPVNAPTLTGTVQFTYCFTDICGVNIGGPVTLTNGVAQVTTTALQANTNQVTATYSGDANYVINSASIPQTVTPAPTFTVTANPTTIPVTAPGQLGSTTLTFTAMNGFSSNGAATVTPVYGGLPSETTCTPSFMVTIPSNGTTTAPITCQTTAPSTVIPALRNRPQISGWRTTAESAFALACLLCAAMLALGYRKKQRGWDLALVFAIFAMLAVSAGCGGGGDAPPPPPPPTNPGTPAPSNTPITISITVNGVTVNVPNMTINVQ
jgi:hypothetical protein